MFIFSEKVIFSDHKNIEENQMCKVYFWSSNGPTNWIARNVIKLSPLAIIITQYMFVASTCFSAF